jgi:hypothetical protein
MQSRLSLGALAFVGFLVASTAVASSSAVRVRVAPSNVTAGNSLFVTAGVSPAGKTCAATISRPGAPAAKLAKKKATSGTASWRWKVPRTAKGGSGTARVACLGAGAGSARFRIKALPPPPPPVPANVVAVKRGIASRLSDEGSTFAGYGIVLQNVSRDEDALDVTVIVNILDASGGILTSEIDNYQAVPAGATYYAGGDSTFDGTPAGVEAVVQTGIRQKKAGILMPRVSNVRVTEDFLGTMVVGEVMNPSTSRSLDSLARISVVCFDGAGNVIGGGVGFWPGLSDLPPGGRIGFDVSVEGLSAVQIASVRVSVEPEYK